MLVVKFSQVEVEQVFYFYLKNILDVKDKNNILCIAKKLCNNDEQYNTFILKMEINTDGKITYFPIVHLHPDSEVMLMKNKNEV